MIIELRVLYYVTCGKLTHACMLMCSVHSACLCCTISEPEYLGFPQDDVKVDVKPLIANGVSCFAD